MIKKFGAIAATMLLCLGLVACGNSYDKKIPGRWYQEVTEEISDDDVKGEMRIRGITEFLQSGSENFEGEMVMTVHPGDAQSPVKSIEFAYDLQFAGEWKVEKDLLVEKIIDVKSHPSYVKVNGEKVSDAIAKSMFDSIGIKIEDLIPRGTASEDKIVSFGDNKFTVETTDSKNKKKLATYERTDKPFSAYK